MRPLPQSSPPIRTGATLPLLLALACLASFLASCAAEGTISPELPPGLSVSEALSDTRWDLEQGHASDAVTRVAAILGERKLSPSDRERAERLGEEAVEALTDPQDPERAPSAEDLEELARLDLPLGLRARLAVAAGRAHLREGSRILAYKYLRDFEEKHPGHPEREAAGKIVAQAGFSLIDDPGHYGWILSYKSKGIGALELLVLRFPFNERCAEAYEALANAYESRGNLDLAIERLEDLLLYHPDSPRAPLAEAHLPRLRMQRVARDDFDRSELERARQELEQWLDRFEERPGIPQELVAEVRADRSRCLVRLANNDLIVARYHRRIKQPFGTRQHAERVISLANLAGSGGQEQIEEARALIAWADRKDQAQRERAARTAGAAASPAEPSGGPRSAPPTTEG